MKKLALFVYGVVAYAVFFLTFLYACGFIGDFGVPKSIDSAPQAPFVQALFADLGLLALFALQHSVMARGWFKRWLTSFLPQPIERSTYVLFSSLALIALFAGWQPLGGMIWEVHGEVARVALRVGFAFGWLLVLYTSFLINHFDLFGLRQVWLQLLGREYQPLEFTTPMAYRLVRHPLYLGWLFTFWSAPAMTASHLVFALATTGYILIAIRLEERDLLRAHREYADYRAAVPMLVPRISSNAARLRAPPVAGDAGSSSNAARLRPPPVAGDAGSSSKR